MKILKINHFIFLLLLFSRMSIVGQFTNSKLANDVKEKTEQAWDTYTTYAWGRDNLKPISLAGEDWYEKSLGISCIDAYSTLHLMGLNKQAERIEQFVADTLDLNKNIKIKVFEINIRVLGGLLNIYHFTKNKKILKKAIDLGDQLLGAFNTPTGLPKFYVYLNTGKPSGSVVNVAEAGSYLLEFGILSYYSKNPKYYQAAKRASEFIFEKRSELGLIGKNINVETGLWEDNTSMVGAYVDSYLEYLYKGYLLFGDQDLKKMFETLIVPILRYHTVIRDNRTWYARVQMDDGTLSDSSIYLWDAYFPGLLALSGNTTEASKAHDTWDWLWNKNQGLFFCYDFMKDKIVDPYFQLNPEIIESAYYLHYVTKDFRYLERNQNYWQDLLNIAATETAFANIKNIETKEKDDVLATFFFAETMKYLYLTFGGNNDVNPEKYVFTTEAHHFEKKRFKTKRLKKMLNPK